MATVKPQEPEAPSEVQVDAASDVKIPAPDSGKEQTVVAHVTAPVGTQVPKAAVVQAAIQSVRNAIPVVYELDPQITGSKVRQQDGEQVREWEVTITYTPRETAGKTDPVDLDKVIRGLDVPRSFDGVGSHDGDADFHDRKPDEL